MDSTKPVTLEGEITHPEAQRIHAFLTHVDAKLTRPLRIQIFGSAAVRLFTANRSESVNATADVDVTGDIKVLKNVDQSRTHLELAAQGNAHRLHFQFKDIQSLCVGPDWTEQTIDATAFLGLSTPGVELLNPLDIAFSKMGRGWDKDLDDCDLLLEAVWGGNPEPLRNYFYRSFPFTMGSTQKTLEFSLLDVLGEKFDPALVQRVYHG